MEWNDLHFCFSDSCLFCTDCLRSKKQLDVAHSYIDESVSENLPIACVLILLDCRLLLVRKFLERARFFAHDELHTKLQISLCCLLSNLLQKLRDFWQTYLEKILSDTTLFDLINLWLLSHTFTARQLQRFVFQLRSFILDTNICTFLADGSISTNWTVNRRTTLTNSLEHYHQFLFKIDECIFNLNKTIASKK